MKNLRLIAALAIILTGCISLSALAEARGHGYSGHGYGWHGYGGYGYGGCPYGGYGYGMQAPTQEQQAAAQKIFQEFQTAVAPVIEQIEAKQDALQAQMDKDVPDSKQIEAISKDLGELRGKMMNARIAMQDKMEKAGLPEFSQGFNQKRGGKRGYMHGGMRGGYGPCWW